MGATPLGSAQPLPPFAPNLGFGRGEGELQVATSDGPTFLAVAGKRCSEAASHFSERYPGAPRPHGTRVDVQCAKAAACPAQERHVADRHGAEGSPEASL